jgi:sugar phosphate isomerase/epimerase
VIKCSFMTFSTPDLTLREVLELARSLGYDGIEPRVDADHRHGVEVAADAATRRAAKALAEDLGVAYACVATSCQYAEPASRSGYVDDTRRAIDLAGDIGAPCVRVFGGTLPASITRAEAIAGVAEALCGVTDQAQSRGVRVCVETHDSWCNPAHIAEVMRRVDHPAIAVNWDIMHPVRTGYANVDQSFEMLRPWIGHTHVHDGSLGDDFELLPLGEGAIDHRRAVELLAGTGYDGYLSGEWIDWTPAAEHLPRELATLRSYIRAAQAA